ncbi:MAG TPA: serine/threonine-protein kinase [Candidatus Thermoplasmatota archaeon]|nr:serine/threonine-protein kinase [Candidatus Thermoplasmatota archaeon]
MRDLTLLAQVPSREELRERIPHRERFRPEPRLLCEPQLRIREDGTGDLLLPRRGSWKHIHELHVEVVRALAAGGDMAAAIERAKPACPPKLVTHTEKLVRRFVWMMHKEGIVEVPLEAPPERFADRFRRVRELGRGGMGIVHLCADEARADAPVVVKHAWGWTKPVERAERSIREEARAMAKFDHPRIPPLVDAFEQDGLLHLVRDFAPGDGLHARPTRLLLGTSQARLATLRECLKILGHIHERGMLYMDVKPENFVLESVEKGPFLLDFGLCRPLENGAIKLRGAVGSAGYAAPEVVKKHVATEASDVYSLGRTFAFVATGKRLRFKHDEAAVVAALDEAGVAGVEREILARMCADDPERRYANTGAVLDAIP